MDIVKALILNYLLILLANILLSVFQWFHYRERVYKSALVFWVITLANFALQGALGSGTLQMSMAFSSSIAVILAELSLLGLASGLRFPLAKYLLIHSAGTVLSLVASTQTDELLWVSLPVALSIGGVMIHGSVSALLNAQKTKDPAGVRFWATIVLLHGLHMLDYPFLRNNQELATVGFSLALFFLVASSILIPSFLLKSISDRYIARLSEVTGELASSQRQLGDMAMMARLGEMSFGFVHDMASPISLLTLYASQLSNLPDAENLQSGKLVSFTRGIENATQRLGRLQQLFRNFVKRDSQREVAEIDLALVLQDCVDLYEPALKRKNINISFSNRTTSGRITTQTGYIDRVVINLIQNALNALVDRPNNAVVIALEDDPETKGVRILVSDTGKGFPPERLNSLWERFGHSETAKSSSGAKDGLVSGGSGFGLYKIREMITEIGGHIEVKSTGSEGTTFLIRLPRSTDLAARGT